MSALNLWIVILTVGVGTFTLRSVFIFALEKAGDLSLLKRVLYFVPPVVMAPLASPSLLLRDDLLQPGPGLQRLIAGLLAGLIAWKTRNILATISGGMAALWLVGWTMQAFS